MATGTVTCGQFAQYLIRKQEHLSDEIIKTILPTDQLAGIVETGSYASFNGTGEEFDRIERVVPDLTGAWTRPVSTGCIGTPCDPQEKVIGLGSTRESFYRETKSFTTDLFCLDLIQTADRAVEQFEAMVFNLREASLFIGSDWLRLTMLRLAGKKWLASSTMADFTGTWNADYTEFTVSALPTSKLTPAHLERRVQPQINRGGMGQMPIGSPMKLGLITDMDTLYSMNQGNAQTNPFWRFTDFGTAGTDFYKMGWSGQIGNYVVRVDLFPLRFMVKNGSPLTLVRVWPFRTAAASLGIKSVDNDDFHRAPYQISFIHNKGFMKHLTYSSEAVNPNMPLLRRDFAGKWQFVMNNLGVDKNTGCVIDNKRGNKGVWIADFDYAARPMRTEWEEAILHLREPMCVTNVALCDSSLTTSYASGAYGSANGVCNTVFVFTPVKNGSNIYQVLADTITCGGQTIDHAAITTPTTIALLVTALNSVAASLGTWAEVAGSTTTIQLTAVSGGCKTVNVPFVGP